MSLPETAVEDWRTQAGCLGVEPEVFFPDTYRDEERLRQARQTCNVCPVWVQCLTLAMRVPGAFDRDGIFAGLTPKDRRDLRGPEPRLMPGEHTEWRGGDPDRRRSRAAEPEDGWDDEALSA